MDAKRRETTYDNIIPLVIESHIVFNQIMKVFNVHWEPARKKKKDLQRNLGNSSYNIRT